MSARPRPPQRLARIADASRVSELMRASVRDLFPRFYDERQTASAAVHIAHLDMKLIADGTYAQIFKKWFPTQPVPPEFQG